MHIEKRVPAWIILLIIILIGLTCYFGYRYYMITKNPNQVANLSAELAKKAEQAEIQKVVGQVSQIMLLPTGESPTIATVADPSLLKNQPFFANTLKDDKVLVYAKAGKAILYRPSINKIIEVAPINIGQNNQNQTENNSVRESNTDKEEQVSTSTSRTN